MSRLRSQLLRYSAIDPISLARKVAFAFLLFVAAALNEGVHAEELGQGYRIAQQDANALASNSKGRFGVRVQDVTPELAARFRLYSLTGAFVVEPMADGPAAKAGIRSGDVITALNGESVTNARNLATRIAALTAGSMASILLLRNGRPQVVTVRLGEPSESQIPSPTPTTPAVDEQKISNSQTAESAKELEAPPPSRDPEDVVAQVLNYTTFGKDKGVGDNFWTKSASSKCKYNLYGNGNALGLRSIDLDELDPKNITFQRLNDQVLFVKHLNQVLIFNIIGADPVLGVDFDRLERGWHLIYSKYCSGKERPF